PSMTTIQKTRAPRASATSAPRLARSDRPLRRARLDERHEILGRSAQIAVPPADEGHRQASAQRGHVDEPEGAETQLLLHAALDQERDPETRLDESLLRGQAVDPDDLGGVDAGRAEPLLERGGEGLASTAPRGKGYPPLARERGRVA